MAGKFHVGKHGPAPCHATKRACRLGADNHFESMEAAEEFVAKQAAAENPTVAAPLKKQKPLTQREAGERLDARDNLQKELDEARKAVEAFKRLSEDPFERNTAMYRKTMMMWEKETADKESEIAALPPLTKEEEEVSRKRASRKELADAQAEVRRLRDSLRSIRSYKHYSPRIPELTEQLKTANERLEKAKAKTSQATVRAPRHSASSSDFPVNPNPTLKELKAPTWNAPGQYEIGGHRTSTAKADFGSNRTTKTRLYPKFAQKAEVEAASGIKYDELKLVKKGVDPAMDEKWKKYNRAEVALAKKNALKTLADMGISDAKVNFSRNAGCGCGCSPGFIVETPQGGKVFTQGKELENIFS